MSSRIYKMCAIFVIMWFISSSSQCCCFFYCSNVCAAPSAEFIIVRDCDFGRERNVYY